MFFTEEDYKKIEKYLASCGVKDSCLEDAKLPIEGNEKIVIVQNGENRILYIRELIEALSNSKASLSDLYNVTDHAKEKYINLKQAIELVPYKARKIGQIITFLNPASKWGLYQFQGTSILQWNELSLWSDFFNLDSYVIKSILPDEEDLTKSENNGKGNPYLSLKDREYSPDEFSGLGKVILRKNIMEVETEGHGKVKKNVLLQDMINKPNTIYEIRYDFDLNNQEITIPEGCVLDFQGGSLSKGVLQGTKFNIKATYKVLDKIKFKGKIIKTLYLDLDWYVSQYTDDIYDNVNIDSSVEINEAIDSGVKNVVFPNDKFYYLKSPIVVNGDINLLSKNNSKEFDSTYRGTLGHTTCIYSNEIITLLNYNYQSSEYKIGLNIGKLNFYCRKPYNNLDNINDPIVKIETTGNNGIWGLNFDANINAVDFQVPVENSPNLHHIPNYTGLKLIANKSYISYVKINGYIQMVYNAIISETKSSTWFTDITINGDTRAVFGGNFDGGDPVKIFGTHQPIAAPLKDTQFKAYFNSQWINFYGFIWDINNTKNNNITSTIQYPIKIINDGFYNSELGNTSIFREPISYIRGEQFNQIKHDYNNYLDYFLNTSTKNKVKIDYTLNDVSIFENEDITLYNIFNLFNTNSKQFSKYRNSSQLPYSLNCYFSVTNTNLQNKENNLKFDCEIDTTNFKYWGYVTPIFISSPYQGNITINVLNSNKGIIKQYKKIITYDDSYYDNSCFYINPFKELNSITIDSTKYIQIKLDLSLGKLQKYEFRELPVILFTTTLDIYKKYIFNTIPKIPQVFINGFTFYHDSLKKHIIGNKNGNWYDALGNIYNALKKGTSSQRPSDIQIGFNYKDTDLNKWVLWNGSNWEDCNGLNVEVKYSGTFSQKPTMNNNIPIGFAYFCTDKQTTEGATNGIMIYYKGDNVWVDALGRVVS